MFIDSFRRNDDFTLVTWTEKNDLLLNKYFHIYFDFRKFRSLGFSAKSFEVRKGCGLKWRNPSLHLKRCFVSCDLLYINRVVFRLCEMYFCELEWVISLNRYIGYMCCGVEVTCSKNNLGKK